ncbi:hypothetical protein [Streptomyces sp. NBC_00670]|jgi:hypothetical protein|uniref:hypothetical protein n=1 Tax=Streptomyces sp. NBC_00670 TaxID=2975804 RepID=UPI002E35712B|nr:hypothetical protein [Streptomyces sp. NBC_00670]
MASAANSPDQHDLAQVAYAAYGASTSHKNFRGDPMPGWDDLGEAIQTAWTAAALAVQADVVAALEQAVKARQSAENGDT